MIKAPSLRRRSTLLLLAAALTGCSDDFLDCVQAWQSCMNECPPGTPGLRAAEDAYGACIDACPGYDPTAPRPEQTAAFRCGRACAEARDAAIASAVSCAELCDDAFGACLDDITGCSDPVSTQYQQSVNVADWGPHDMALLADPDNGIYVCDDHFPLFSAERAEIENAIRQFDGVPNSSIGFFALSQPHGDKSVLFDDPPNGSSFDYIDNAADAFVHPCHPDNTTACGDNDALGIDGFTINTCSYAGGAWQGSGDREFFAITANAACYDYFTDPTSDNYVLDSGALHELGHAAGMVHSEGWPTADQQYISTMQGNLKYLSAYDIAFLRAHYLAISFSSRDFVASSKIRLDFGGPNEVNGTFGQKNPKRLYLVGDVLHDCATQQPAVFHAAWFNTGTAEQSADHCMMNELRLEDPTTYHEAKIVRWHVATMPAESQDHWVGSSATVASDFVGIGRGRDIDLVFEANVYAQYLENDPDNNLVKTPVKLFDTSACTPPPAPPPPPPLPIRQIGPTSYDIAPALLNQVVADPLTVARGAIMAPAKVGSAGLGLKIKSLDKGSVLTLMGAQAGDILWRVDGQPITGANTAFAAMTRLQLGATVTVTYLRGATMRQVTYKKR